MRDVPHRFRVDRAILDVAAPFPVMSARLAAQAGLDGVGRLQELISLRHRDVLT